MSENTLVLDEYQSAAAKAIFDWYALNQRHKNKRPERFILAGLAGTGKTTIVKYIIGTLGLDKSNVAFCAFTGKAALVMTRKGTPATTIHRLMYKVGEDLHGKPIFTRRSQLSESIKLIVVDEASMVSKEIQSDLESYQIPVLYVGDHGQLPPVGEENSLMLKPNVRLEKIHRQAEGNPIIMLSKLARLGAFLHNKSYGEGVSKIPKAHFDIGTASTFDQVLCGKNITRHELNKKFRAHLGLANPGDPFSYIPVSGDRVISLKNVYSHGLINGLTGKVTFSGDFDYGDINEDDLYKYPSNMLAIDFDNEDFSGSDGEEESFSNIPYQELVFAKNFIDQKDRYQYPFDYAYAITVHKSQGSQYNSVLIMEEYLGDKDMHKRWLYTAITRAVESVVIVGSK